MPTDFNLTQIRIEEADIYDSEKSSYIHNYLLNYFRTKLELLNRPNHTVECITHSMEKYTVSDTYSAGGHGFCFDRNFSGWENTLSIHGIAKFTCGKDFPIGYYFQYRNKNLIEIIDKLKAIPDNKLIKGIVFDEKNILSIITGFMRNNFSSIHGYYSPNTSIM